MLKNYSNDCLAPKKKESKNYPRQSTLDLLLAYSKSLQVEKTKEKEIFYLALN